MSALRHKYNAVPQKRDGHRYDSKAELAFSQQLDQAKRAGVIIQYLRQVPFHLPGGVKYVCDFCIFEAGGAVRFVDVKGMDTPVSKVKRKQVEELYAPIVIEVVK
jgi:hypothetical protein